MEVDNTTAPSTTVDAEHTTAGHDEHQPATQHHDEDEATKNQQQQQGNNGGSSIHKRVLIAIDRSEHSERALCWYATKLHTPGDLVLFLNVAEPPEMALGFGMAGAAVAEIYTAAMEETIKSATRLAGKIKETCRTLGIEKMRFLERIGHSAGQAIVEVADEEQVDLIVLGSRGVGLLRRTFLGSVSDYVLHHSKRAAVTVVPALMSCRIPDCSADSKCPRVTAKNTGTAAHCAQPHMTSQEDKQD